MANMMAAGAAWMTATLAAAQPTAITYRRGDHQAEAIAVIGRTTFEATTAAGVIESWEARDYLIQAGRMPFGQPERGDRITEGAVVYEVAAPAGVPVFRYGDAYRTVVRVHTKYVGPAS